MTIYEALGIEETLINFPIPKDTILDNIQYSALSRSAKHYFEVIDRVVLRASIHRSDFELQIVEISLNTPKYIHEISQLIQTAIKYRILFIFVYDDRYLIARRNFRLTESTDHVYSEYLSYSTEWIYEENLIADIICNYQASDIANDSDDAFAYTSAFWKADDVQTRFYQTYSDILNNVGQLNQCMIDSDMLSLRQFCDWYIGHSTKDRLELMPIVEAVITNNGIQDIDGNMFFDKNIISYTIANLENSKYLRTIDHFGRHPFTYFDDISPIDEIQIESDVLKFIYSEHQIAPTSAAKHNFEGFTDDTIRRYFDLVGSYAVLSAEKERLLFDQMENGDQEARELLIKSNLKLVVSIARKYVNNGLDLDDLIQEGTLGLISALEKHETWYGTRFATYAKYWIKQAIQRAIMDQSNLIRLPVHFSEDLEKIERSERILTLQLGREPRVDEIAAHQKMSVSKVRELQKFSGNFIELEEPVNEYGESEIDLAIDEDDLSTEDWVIQRDLRHSLESVLETLTPREEQVIKLRFGLDDGRQRSLEEVGKEFDITRERIREIEAKALRKLRHPSRSKRLKGYLDDTTTQAGGFVGFACEDYSIPQYTYINDMIRRWHLRGWNIIEEAKLSYSIISKLRKDGFQVLEQLQTVEYDALDRFTMEEKVELLSYLDSINIRLSGCDRETYLTIDDYFKEIIRCEECGASLDEGDWSIDKKVCNSCQKRLERVFDIKDFEVIGKTARFYGLFANRFVFTVSVQDESGLTDVDDLLIESVALVSTDNEVLFSNEHSLENDQDDELFDDTIVCSLTARWRWAYYEFDFETVASVNLVIKDLKTNKYHLFVFSLDEKSVFGERKIFGVELFDVFMDFDYANYQYKQCADEVEITEDLQNEEDDDSLDSLIDDFDKESIEDDFLFEDDPIDSEEETKPKTSVPLSSLPNIGASMVKRLQAIGISTANDLLEAKIENVWDKLYEDCAYTDCVEIWSIEGAKQGVLYLELDESRKAELKEYVDKRKGREKPDPEELSTLPNIGIGLADKLKSVGIASSSALMAETTEGIWEKLYAEYPSVDCYEIYAIEGAKLGVKMSNLDKTRKNAIRDYVRKRKA